MEFGVAIHNIFDSLAGQAIYGLTVLIFLNFALGVTKALSQSNFKWEFIDLFVRVKLLGRLTPILLLLIAGEFASDLSVLGLEVNVLTAAGLAAAIPVAASELQSILANANFGTPDTEPEGARG